ncbi:Pyridine nucleotide disulfide oxidoreductase FAD binding domain [Trypanosoma vivax]|uniref:Putative dihydrolipoamide dehydrogenase, point mutation n=1 Tax=Trypanosoma vivax (strain Y486) TaxID=1055687 RepID=G0TZQ1_TRYVY|nr:putative dihydrolipoamide dehydrogenase, point mutation [Trypanosoma vivax]KAH8617687.1 Pyridine nucleotide disulfide oxidoreductase FAD binding domain [Trypanosoma vivax]CCC50079.1 putative dihydrolipoamide dehydrogenase, point mutation [Trypanosoma vivax Y486]
MLRFTVKFYTQHRPPLVHWRPLGRKHYDVCVIGAGPAGVAAALRAVDYGKRVCLVEANRVGGCDLWNGALQSKVLWEMSTFLARANGNCARRVYGTSITNYMELDEDRMRQTLILSSEEREKQLISALDAANITLLYGHASLASAYELEVRSRGTKEYHIIVADYFIIATGSVPKQHPYVKVDRKRVVTSDDLMMMPLPKSMVIVGAGVLGSEFASIYAQLGRTDVRLIDKKERIMSMEDDDVVAAIQSGMEKNGVTIHQGCQLYDLQSWEEDELEMRDHPEDETRRSGVRYTVMHCKTRKLQTFEVDRALIAVGRQPNYLGLGLGNTNCKVLDGELVLDEFGRCLNQPHIYAVGDAASGPRLVSMGEAKGRLAIDHIYSRDITEPLSPDYSRITFFSTAVAAVGKNEKQCQENNISYIMAKYSFDLCSRNVAANSTEGFVKILATNDGKKTLLGVRIVGWSASTIVEFASAAIRRKQSAYELSEMLTAYPSVSQAFQECLRVILGTSVLKPGTFPGLVCSIWTPPGYERGRAHCGVPASKREVVKSP